MTKRNWILSAGVLFASGLLAWIWLGRGSAEKGGIHDVAADADIPPAAVARVERRNVGSTLAIAGEFKPFQEVDVHAKVAGYIRQIYVDVGDHVKEGQTLAVLEVPELAAQLTGSEAAVRAAEQQIRKAQGDVQRAQSSHAAAHSAYVRLKQAADSRPGLVAQQDIDDSQAKDLETEGQTASAEAELAAAKQQLEV
jgi:multidrug efflux pump subunit AcrA (membrane-fusion protein)